MGVAARGLQCGREAEDDRDRHRYHEGEGEDDGIERRGADARHVGWRGRDEYAEHPGGKQDADAAANEGEQNALRQRHPNESQATGAEGGSYGQLMLACARTRQHEIRHVHAADQEEKPDRAKQDPECLRCRGSECPVEHRHRHGAHVLPYLGIGDLRQPGEPGHRCARCLHGGARGEPGNGLEDEVVAPAKIGVVLRAESERQVHVDVERPAHVGRQDADDRPLDRIELDGQADDVRPRAKLAAPEPIRDHHGTRRVDRIIHRL